MPRGTAATPQDQEQYTDEDLANFDFSVPESTQEYPDYDYPSQASGQSYDPSSYQETYQQPGYPAATPASEH